MDRAKAGYAQGVVSILVNTGLFALKMWAGIVSGSIALTADAWHTLSDSISSIVVVVAVKLSSRKPDKEHPFGHGRWEQIAALFIGFLLALIAYDFLRDSILLFKNREAANFGLLAIIVTVVSVIVKEALAQYAFYIGKKTDNVSIKADGWHHRTDALSSLVVLIGILFAQRFWWIDSVLGIVIALMLFYATYEIVKEAIGKLLGEKPSAELIEKVEKAIDSVYQGDVKPHHYHIHNYVAHQELTFHIKLDNNLSLMEAHKVATDIEDKIHKLYGIIATIHIEPINYKHRLD